MANVTLGDNVSGCVAVELELKRLGRLPERSPYDMYVECDQARQRVSLIGARMIDGGLKLRKEKRTSDKINGIVAGLSV